MAKQIPTLRSGGAPVGVTGLAALSSSTRIDGSVSHGSMVSYSAPPAQIGAELAHLLDVDTTRLVAGTVHPNALWRLG
jgi:hypothetical protein